jgi:HSP20 family protein
MTGCQDLERKTMPFRPLQDTQLSLSNLQDEINKGFERIWHSGVSTRPFDGQQWAPVVDLYEFENCYMLYAEIPGVDGSAVEVTYLDNALTIRGEKPRPDEAAQSERSVRNERRYGAFCRTVDLPPGIDADRLSAQCSSGVLQVTIPKSEASRPKAVKIDIQDS